jgi:hypothetical protein
MANQAVVTVVPLVAVAIEKYPPISNPVLPSKTVLPPPGNVAAGGPTSGQLFPVGNR